MPGVVWILGAGFSKSLGGPLLDDLLQPDCLRRLGATFPRDGFPLLHGPLPEAVVWLFHYGRRFAAGRRNSRIWTDIGESLWRDAEDFLDFVDAAAASEKGPACATLDAILNHRREDLFGNGASAPNASEVRAMARRLIGAECSAFLQSADVETERWGPYQRWMHGLVQSGDSIITFNYDLVLELLCRKLAHVNVQLPGPRTVHGVPVLKLHGSVNWRRIGTDRFEAQGLESAHCCRCESSELAIATPGRTKREISWEFDSLWAMAAKAIRNAEAVVFLGYRFPPSDAMARGEILGALKQNQTTLPIHTVLGPDVNSADSARLQGLLRHVGISRIHQQPLYVEDFLGVVARENIV